MPHPKLDYVCYRAFYIGEWVTDPVTGECTYYSNGSKILTPYSMGRAFQMNRWKKDYQPYLENNDAL